MYYVQIFTESEKELNNLVTRGRINMVDQKIVKKLENQGHMGFKYIPFHLNLACIFWIHCKFTPSYEQVRWLLWYTASSFLTLI